MINLRDPIVVQQLTGGVDTAGQPVNTWTDLATIWADIRYNNGTQAIKANEEASITQASMRVRARTDITTDMRILANGKLFDIKAILPVKNTRQYMDLVVVQNGR